MNDFDYICDYYNISKNKDIRWASNDNNFYALGGYCIYTSDGNQWMTSHKFLWAFGLSLESFI
jgi:hypothetical protein